MDNPGTEILLAIALGFLFYLTPTFIAFGRRHPNRWVILALNICLGGTGIVWLGCLIWAMMAIHISNDPEGSNGGESGLNIFVNDPVKVRIEPPPLPNEGRSPPSAGNREPPPPIY